MEEMTQEQLVCSNLEIVNLYECTFQLGSEEKF